jgi:hypothetical protein
MKGAGNSSAILYYSFMDEHPYYGINYYRLMQTDFNGEYKYSQIIAVRNNQTDIHCFVYLDERTGNFILSCNHQENSQAQILNVDGRIMKVIEMTGSSENKIDLNRFADGLYILRIIDRQRIQNFKLLKN